MSKIVIISPSREFTDLVRDTVRGKDYKIYSPDSDRDFYFEETIPIAKEEEQKGAEVVITRGGQATLLQQTIQIPVVEVKMSVLDILRTHDLLKKSYSRIALIGVENVICDYQELGNYIDIQIYPIFSYEQDLDLQVRKALTNHVDFIIGDGMSVDYAKKFGIPGIKLMPSRNSIQEAVEVAENLVLARFQERKNSEQFRLILETSQDGILIISDNHHITLVNDRCVKLLKKMRSELINKKVDTLLTNKPGLYSLLEKKQEFDGEIISLQDSIVSVTKHKIQVADNHVGWVVTLQDITRIQQLEQSIRKKLNTNGFVAKFNVHDMISECREMKNVVKKIHQFSRTDSTILILGETGTGKELAAQSIHNLSSRNNRPFVPINCGALPTHLLESELFGYEPGAFTGAHKNGKPGLFELAHTGTIFLDEIGEIPLELQSRLLRVLQEKQVMRIGGSSIIPVDVRIITATHRDLHADILKGTFRTDLFYRLNILSLTLPPLKDRQEDIPYLLDSLLKKMSSRYKCPVPDLPTAFINRLQQYQWPGNIREMENIVEKIVVLSTADLPLHEILGEIETELEGTLGINLSSPELGSISESTLSDIEKSMIQYHLRRFAGNKELVAKQLGISRATLWRKLKDSSIADGK